MRNISIHALTRSATGLTLPRFGRLAYFNPRTHEECDNLQLAHWTCNRQFQSTHSRGVRRPSLRIYADTVIISIHALTRSATRAFPHHLRPQQLFQSTHSRGVRRHQVNTCICLLLFQSTHSRGVRQAGKAHAGVGSFHFNPRTHEECDPKFA